VQGALTLIRQRWNGLKHVWEPTSGWPFEEKPQLNDELVLKAGKIIFLQRRNLLKRYISWIISRRLNFWIGTRYEFLARLERTALPELHPDRVRADLELSKQVIERRRELLAHHQCEVMNIFYEDFYGEETTMQDQLEIFNRILAFLGLNGVTPDLFRTRCNDYLRPDINRWSSQEVYRRMPGIETIERELGGDEFGCLFN